MKAIFIAYNQAYYDEVISVLEARGQRGFTEWQDIHGRGSVDGTPHMGNHAWPEMNFAILSMVDDDKVQPLLDDLKAMDEASKDLGLRAFVWNIEAAI